jgi:uncharacterized protein
VGARDSYPEGTFCWVDLVTGDADAAKRFYGGLFGWEAPGAGERYAHWTLDGRDVAGVYSLPGVESRWTSYVAVEDAAATAARAAAAGGSVVEPAAAVGSNGTRAVVADPLGTPVALWQAGEHAGAQLVNDVGCWCSNQLQAPDPAPAAAFYEALFGWELVEEQDSVPPYWAIRHRGRDGGGMVGGQDGPPAWVVYFHVADADESAAAAEAAGGAVPFPPTTVGIGRLAVCADPQGAAFGIFAGPTDP